MHLLFFPPPARRSLLLLLGALLLAACRESAPPEQPAAGPGVDLLGTWEVVNEPVYPYSRNGQRYSFFQDSTVHIQRPPSLGVSSPVLAAYDFEGDTLVIRSPFGTEMLLPELRGDSLLLNTVGSTRPMLLVRLPGREEPTPPPQPPPPGADGVYSPPPDVAPEEQVPTVR